VNRAAFGQTVANADALVLRRRSAGRGRRQHVSDHTVGRVHNHELVVNYREIIWSQRRIIGCRLAWYRLNLHLHGVRHEGARRGIKARNVLIGRLLAQVVPDALRCAADKITVSVPCSAVAADAVATPHTSSAAADTNAVYFLI